VRRTLTGFKWICRAALDTPQFVFAYEEALGYCFASAPDQAGVLDKDGLCAATIMGRMLAAAGSGAALLQQLRDLYGELGLFGSFGQSLRLDSARDPKEQMAQLMVRHRQQGPALDAGWTLAHYEDFMVNAHLRPSYLGQQDLLSFELIRRAQARGPRSARILVRPSGTEPKLKLYVHLQTDWDDSMGYQVQLARLQSYVTGLGESFFNV
jgi:phosphomannomutase